MSKEKASQAVEKQEIRVHVSDGTGLESIKRDQVFRSKGPGRPCGMQDTVVYISETEDRKLEESEAQL